MKLHRIKGLLAGLFAAVMLLVSIGSTAAQAQGRRIYIYRYPRPFYHRMYDPFWGPWDRTVTVVDPIAEQRESGYSDGHKRGKDDAKHHKPNDPTRHKHYNQSNSLAYRQAFLQGYAEGYREQMNKLG